MKNTGIVGLLMLLVSTLSYATPYEAGKGISRALATKTVVFGSGLSYWTPAVGMDVEFDASNDATYTASTEVIVFDEFGQSHVLGMFFVKRPSPLGEWHVYLTLGEQDQAVRLDPNLTPEDESDDVPYFTIDFKGALSHPHTYAGLAGENGLLITQPLDEFYPYPVSEQRIVIVALPKLTTQLIDNPSPIIKIRRMEQDGSPWPVPSSLK